jgi:FKBP-type peptidyl-prolyl cis-trans isomerase 2
MHQTQAKLGDRVRIQFSWVSKPTTQPLDPRVIEFTIGSRKVLRGLSLGIIGMTQGDQKRFTLEPAQAYGPVQLRLIREIPRTRIPSDIVLRVGKRLTVTEKASGRHRRVRVVEIKPNSVVVDGNHRHAGKVIRLDVKLISVDPSSYANRSQPQFDMGGES